MPTGDLALANYTGHDYDAVLGVYFAQARVYDAESRRFVSRDPEKGWVVDVRTYPQYICCLHTPLINIDPRGKSSVLVPSLPPPPTIYHTPTKKSAGSYYTVYTCQTTNQVGSWEITINKYTMVYELSVENKNPGSFVTFTDNSAYGGDQGWMKDRNRHNGCGPTAAANIVAYYAQTNFDGIGQYLVPNATSMSKQDMVDLMNDLYDIINPWDFWADENTASGVGVWFMDKVTGGIKAYADAQGVRLQEKRMSNFSATFESACEFIRAGIKRDAPVLMYIKFNDAAKAGNNNSQTAERHFMTITRMEEHWEHVVTISRPDGKVLSSKRQLVDAELTLSNWGGRTQTDFRKIWEDLNISRLAGGNVTLSYLVTQ